MILFTILAILALALAIAVGSVVLAGGTIIFALFGDIIVFVLIVVLIVRLVRRKKK